MPPILHEVFGNSFGGIADDSRVALALFLIMLAGGALAVGFFLTLRLGGRFRTTGRRAAAESIVLAVVVVMTIFVLDGRLPGIWLLYVLSVPALAVAVAIWRNAAKRYRRSRTSGMKTSWLAGTIDRETGVFDAQILKGSYSGAFLSALNSAELRLLMAEIGPDQDSIFIVEAYIQHAHSGTRGGGEEGSSSKDGMSMEEALNLLGLEPVASVDEIKRAYRQLMKRVHPDHGGTDYLAHKLTEAKRRLLGE